MRMTRLAFAAARTCLAAWLLASLGPAAATASDVDSELAALGSTTYRVYCRSCHGVKGEGDGTLAELLKVPPADLTRIAERHGGTFPDDDVAAVIDGREAVRGHGDREMPVWGNAFQSDEGADEEQTAQVAQKIRQLVAFLASIQRSDGE